MDQSRKNRLLTLSATKLTTWFFCPMAFYLKYVEHEWIPEKIRLVFGKAIHYMLNKFYDVDYKNPQTFGRAWNYYWLRKLAGEDLKGKQKNRLQKTLYPTNPQTCLVPEAPTPEDGVIIIGNHVDFGSHIEDGGNYCVGPRGRLIAHPKVGVSFSYMKEGRRILTRFYKRHKNRAPPVHRELRKTTELFGQKFIVIFDRIDVMPDGRWFITDYKTDKRCPGDDEGAFTLHRNVQFTGYSAVARQLARTGHLDERIQGEEEAILFYHLRSGRVLKTHRSEKDFVYLEKLLDRATREIERAIETGDFVPAYSHQCGFCDYKVSCEKYSVSYGGPTIVEGEKIKRAKEFLEWYDSKEILSLAEEER